MGACHNVDICVRTISSMRVFVFTLLMVAGFGSVHAIDLSPSHQLLLDSQRALRDRIPPLDGEYLDILRGLEDQANVELLTHRDTQWKAVAQAMRELAVGDRVELVDSVRLYPLYRVLPDEVMITPRALGHWHVARKTFLEMVRTIARRGK